jgi:hypothetical protein
MSNWLPLNGTSPVHDHRPYAMLGAGRLVSSLWKHGDQHSGWAYRFNIFRMSTAGGRVSQLLQPRDVHDLVKLCRVLAAELATDGCLPPAQRRALADLAETLNDLTDSWRP